ncbi:hypothetical protein TSUD_212080 [Trifolium subterraneum]|uniref:Uncharacterized protein n=1 Tax=Trifolium subterraneum TaxID=3900 RepID=A0A2Z6MH28_TRISU|nr:hypothetical protein TSUD_212080 [Trifolium subterraneum]
MEYKSVRFQILYVLDFHRTRYFRETTRTKRDAKNLASRSIILSFIGIHLIVEHLYDNEYVLPVKDIAQSHKHLQELDGKDIVNVVATDNMIQIEIVYHEPEPNISKYQQLEIPTHEPIPEATKSSNGFQQPNVALPIDNVISAKKRRRNNYKANKRVQLAVAQ